MNTQTQDLANKVHVVFMTKPTKKHPFTIPITKLRDRVFITGQDLSYKKMIGEVDLTKEEEAKYPVVIDPTEHYKVIHMQPLYRNNDYDKAIIDLLLLSGRIAESKAKYDEKPVEYVGYLKDELAESNAFIAIEDERYEAETAVRESTIDDYKKIALIVNYRMGKSIDVLNMPDQYVKGELIKAAKENPKAVKMCFPKWNPAVAEDIYILQLIRHNILTRQPNGDIYDGEEFIGVGIDAVGKFMKMSSKSHYLNKWKTLLDRKLGLVSQKVAEQAIDGYNKNDRQTEFDNLLSKVKVAIVDENLSAAEYHLDRLTTEFADLLEMDVEVSLNQKVDDLKLKKVEDKTLAEKKKFRESLEILDLNAIQSKITHGKTPFKKEECESFWEDKMKLIEYMVTIKFSE